MNSRPSTLTALTTLVVTFVIGFSLAFSIVKSRDSTGLSEAVETVVESSSADSTIALDLESTIAADSTIPDTQPPDTAPAATKRPPATTPPVRSVPPLTTDGAVLGAPGSPEPRQFNPDDSCSSLARTGSAELCDIVSIGDATFAWVFEGGGEGVDLLALDPDLSDVYRVQLRSNRLPTQTPRFVDVTGDGQPEIVLGWRDDESLLDVDIVEIRGRSLVVTLHLRLVDGRLSAGGGSLDAWNGVRQTGDDPANPTSFDRWTYSKEGGRWVVTAERDDNPPTGQL